IVGADQTTFDALTDAPVVATENPTKKVDVKKNKARRNDKGRLRAAAPAPSNSYSEKELELMKFRIARINDMER
ncbi:hypothetical protein MKW92_023855, partial [Papaver armeniacum]